MCAPVSSTRYCCFLRPPKPPRRSREKPRGHVLRDWQSKPLLGKPLPVQNIMSRVLLAFPEDFGAIYRASIIVVHERSTFVRTLVKRNVAVAFSASSVTRTNVILSEVSRTARHVVMPVSLGWPFLRPEKTELIYGGPLPRTCTCITKQTKITGITDGILNSAMSVGGFEVGFWKLLFADFWAADSVKDGARSRESHIGSSLLL